MNANKSCCLSFVWSGGEGVLLGAGQSFFVVCPQFEDDGNLLPDKFTRLRNGSNSAVKMPFSD